jgi:hypothetical protein
LISPGFVGCQLSNLRVKPFRNSSISSDSRTVWASKVNPPKPV